MFPSCKHKGGAQGTGHWALGVQLHVDGRSGRTRDESAGSLPPPHATPTPSPFRVTTAAAAAVALLLSCSRVLRRPVLVGRAPVLGPALVSSRLSSFRCSRSLGCAGPRVGVPGRSLPPLLLLLLGPSLLLLGLELLVIESFPVADLAHHFAKHLVVPKLAFLGVLDLWCYLSQHGL